MKKRSGFRLVIEVTKQTFKDFSNDKVFKMAAALSYSTVIALPALLIVLIWVSGIFYNPEDIRGGLLNTMNELLGREAVTQIQDVMENTKFDYSGAWAKALGVATLLLSATGVFGEIQDSINTIWSLKTKPKAGIIKVLINRLLSFSLIVSLGFILIVSLVINALISALVDNIQQSFPEVPILVFYILNQVFIFGILLVLFSTIFKVLPDAKIKLRQVLLSSMITALMFMLGKFGIEMMLSGSRTVSAYGSAGAVIVILLWVYYSSVILYLGAEFTQAYLKVKGERIKPNRYAVWVEKQEVEVKSNTEASKENAPQPARK